MQVLTEKDNQKVADVFNAVINELNRIADDMKMACANAAMEGDFEKMDEAKFSALEVKRFVEEVTSLSSRWEKVFFSQPIVIPTVKPALVQETLTNNFTAAQSRASRTSRTKLRVTFVNSGKQVCLNNCAKTFVEVLRMLNLDEVAKLGTIVNKHHLVSKTKLRFDSTIYQCGNWFIDTLSNTNQKKIFLEQISRALKVPIRVDII